jgi:hypothetical protein
MGMGFGPRGCEVARSLRAKSQEAPNPTNCGNVIWGGERKKFWDGPGPRLTRIQRTMGGNMKLEGKGPDGPGMSQVVATPQT